MSKESSPQNSQFRELTRKPMQTLASFLHEKMPWLTPNEVTLLGTASLAGFVLYVAREQKKNNITVAKSIELIIEFIALSLSDAADGALARHIESVAPGTHNARDGQLVDSLSDRAQEAFLAWLGMYRAAQNDDKLWFLTATLAAYTNPLSSLVRAWAEKNNIVVPETSGVLGTVGTRGGRVAMATTRLMPHMQKNGVSVQGVVDGVTAVSTTKTAYDRYQAVKNGQSYEGQTLSAEKQEDAERRFKWLAGLAVVSGAVTTWLYVQYKSK